MKLQLKVALSVGIVLLVMLVLGVRQPLFSLLPTHTAFAARCRPDQACGENDRQEPVEIPEDLSPMVVTFQSIGLGQSRDRWISSESSFIPDLTHFRSNEAFTISASATDADGITQVAVVGTATAYCFGQRVNAASPEPVSLTQYAIREEITAADSPANLSIAKTMRAMDFPCSSHSLARIEFTVHGESKNVDNEALSTHAIRLVYIKTLKVMTFNIQGGIGLNAITRETVYNITNAAAVILQNDIDIALLQEVRRHWDGESNWEDQVELLSQETGMHAAYMPRNFRFRPGSCELGFWTNAACPYPDRSSGLLILSKFPIIDNTEIVLSTLERIIAFPDSRQHDRLGYQQADIDVGGTPMRVLNLHNCLGGTPNCPSWDDQGTMTRDILERVGTPALPVLIGGDFNIDLTYERNSTQPIMDSPFEHVCSLYNPCVNWSPGLFEDGWYRNEGIDHLFVWDSGSPKFAVVDGYVPWTGTPPFQASDHFPLVARLKFSDN